jgi:hypothetical protein
MSTVELKRKYNDVKRSTRDPNILSGAEWYEIQVINFLGIYFCHPEVAGLLRYWTTIFGLSHKVEI